MSEQQIRVTFQPSGRSVFVLSGTKVIEAAARAGYPQMLVNMQKNWLEEQRIWNSRLIPIFKWSLRTQ